METLHRSVRRQGSLGAPLPSIFPSLEAARILFRRSGFSMVAGRAGNYKSTFVQNLCAHWVRRDSHMAILYVAADSDNNQVSSLMAAMVSGDPTSKTELTVASGGYADALASVANIEWEFRALDHNEISERMDAMKDKWGKFPDLVVVDNLMNIVINPTDYSGQSTMMRNLKAIALSSGSHVMVLHHTRAEPQKKTRVGYPPPRWEIHGKLEQFPTLVLTIATDIDNMRDYGVLRVAPVKNRTGPDDESGETFIEYEIKPSNGRVSEIPEAV